ncbi:MAG: hypothetical protein HZB53_15605 [Chloroflexi bacterium]|nr:hypothetical protein [Chloroflexota bacterium]
MKHTYSLLLAVLATLVMVAACAPGATPTPTAAPAATPTKAAAAPTTAAPAAATTAPAAPTTAPTAAPKAKVTLKFVTQNDDTQLAAFKEILAEFQKSENGKWSYVDIAFDAAPFVELFPKILTNVAVGAEMDLVFADGPVMKHYAFNRVLTPLGKYFSDAEKKQWAPQSLEEGSFRGELYGPPIMQSCSMLMYNQDMIDAAGIKPPTALADSWTFEQALPNWQKATKDTNGDGVPDQWGVRLGQGTAYSDYETGIWRRSAGAPGSNAYKGIADDGVTLKGYLDDPDSIKAMQFWQDLTQKYKVTPVEAIPQIFETKKAAFMITPDNRIGVLNRLYPNAADFKWGVTGIPYFKTQMCHTGSWHYGIAATTKRFEEVLAFVRFASSDTGARIWYKYLRQLPANVAILSETAEYKAGGRQSLWAEGFTKAGVPRIQTPGYQEYSAAFLEMATDISTGANVQQAMQTAVKRAETAIARYKGWNK